MMESPARPPAWSMESYGLAGVIASFGHARPGMLALHNYPDTLRDLERPRDATGRSGGSTWRPFDVIRDRERGVPRYNDFRRMLRMRPVAVVRGADRRRRHDGRGAARGVRRRWSRWT